MVTQHSYCSAYFCRRRDKRFREPSYSPESFFRILITGNYPFLTEPKDFTEAVKSFIGFSMSGTGPAAAMRLTD